MSAPRERLARNATRPRSDSSRPPEDPLPPVLAWAGVVVTVLAGGLAALVELMLVPLYAGTVVVPLAVVLAIVGNVVLPRLARAIMPGTAALPVLLWLVVVIGFGAVPRPLGDVILPGGDLQWVSYGLLLLGGLAGVLTVVLGANPPRR